MPVTSEGETMGKRLKRLREGAKMTQAELAERTGIPLGTIRNWEQDVREPRLGQAVSMARVLGITVDTLAGTDEPPPRRKKR
jgi:transcriptional regulator with XRE-family HTH domain